MKTTYTYLMVLFLTGLLSIQCSEDDEAIATYPENVTISNDETYSFLLGEYDANTITEIEVQATNYERSEFEKNENTKTVYYVFKPQADYVGEETVVVYTENLIPNSAKQRITFQITITE